MVQAEIVGHSNGCLFRRADLHIHSFGEFGSYDVTDATMTPEAIVDTAIAEGLKVIAIADHNSVGNVRAAVKYAEGKDMLVVPAIELSTQQGHLLVYCPTPAALESFYGKLTISGDKKACSETIMQALNHAAAYGGRGLKRAVVRLVNLSEIATRDRVDESIVYDKIAKRLTATITRKGNEKSSPFRVLGRNPCTAFVKPNLQSLDILRCSHYSNPH